MELDDENEVDKEELFTDTKGEVTVKGNTTALAKDEAAPKIDKFVILPLYSKLPV